MYNMRDTKIVLKRRMYALNQKMGHFMLSTTERWSIRLKEVRELGILDQGVGDIVQTNAKNTNHALRQFIVELGVFCQSKR